MVATLIFLNRRLAVGAGFGVGEQPQTVGSILVGFTHTSHWPESREGGEEAKWKWDSTAAQTLCLINVPQKIWWRPCGGWRNKISTYVPLVSFQQLSLATSSRSHSHRARALHPCTPCIHAIRRKTKSINQWSQVSTSPEQKTKHVGHQVKLLPRSDSQLQTNKCHLCFKGTNHMHRFKYMPV